MLSHCVIRVRAAFSTRCRPSSYSQCLGNRLAPASRWVLLPSACTVSSIVVQTVNGRVTRNGGRAEGLRNENPGRPPAVWTNRTVSLVTAGSLHISWFALVGSSMSTEPMVIGGRPMMTPPA